METNDLILSYPLLKEEKENLIQSFAKLRYVLSDELSNDLGMPMPDRALSELCQLGFYIAINVENLLDDKFDLGVELIKTKFGVQLTYLKDDLAVIARNSFDRGVPKENILEYLMIYYLSVHQELFPQQPIIDL